MQYFGAADYYFWQGVKDATGPVVDNDVNNPPKFHQDNQVTQSCIEAWQWGFSLGRNLTEKEYLELTTEPDLRDNMKTETEEPVLEETNIVGNC